MEAPPASRACQILIGRQRIVDRKIARAKAARDARKSKSDQLKAIKAALRIPLEVRIAEAKQKEKDAREAAKQAEQERKREERWLDNRADMAISNHYQTSNKELSGGDLLSERLSAAENDDPDISFGGKRVAPQGTGHRFGHHDDGVGADGTPDADSSPDPWTEDAENKSKTPILSGDIFSVTLADKDWREAPAFQCIPDFFAEVLWFRYDIHCINCGARQDDDETTPEEYFICGRCGFSNGGDDKSFVCRLCDSGDILAGEKNAAHHMTTVHGDEKQPEHDARFGNVLRRWLRGGKKAPNIEKARRKAAKAVMA
jgi:hypothetical protein